METTYLFVVVCMLGLVTVNAAPSDLKDIDLETNEVKVNKKLYKKGVAVNWGGYQAQAGLGGDPSGGGLYASAGVPNGPSASTGLFGSSNIQNRAAPGQGPIPVYYDAQTGSSEQNGGPFFDKVFAIPINVLHSVNDYLKSKGKSGVHAASGHSAGTELRFGATDENKSAAGSTFASADAGANTGTFSSAGASSSTGSVHGVHGQSKPDYDKVFNIPITALKSVSDFLGGR